MNALAPSFSRHKSRAVEAADAQAWLRRPLCRTYALAHFGRSLIPLREARAYGLQEWHWAVGVLPNGEQEVLGAWRVGADPQGMQVWEDLGFRGVQRVNAIATDRQGVAEGVPLLKGWRVASGPASVQTLRHDASASPGGEASRKATETASRVQCAVDRSSRRHGPVATDNDAELLMATVLRRIDCALSLSARSKAEVSSARVQPPCEPR
jgi:hypothetical protein